MPKVYIFDEFITRFVLIEGDCSKYNFFGYGVSKDVNFIIKVEV